MSGTSTIPVSLESLRPGSKGKVAGFDLPADQQSRLFEMGLTHGAQVEMVRTAPLGDPIEIKIRGYHLSLRKREAAGIQVNLL